MQDICLSLEDALKQRVKSGQFPLNIYTGIGDYVKESPYIILHARDGEEFPQDSGNWNLNVMCGIEWPANDLNLQGFRELCANVFGLLQADDLATLLSDATNLAVMGIFNRRLESDTDGQQWQAVLSFTCYCCLSDLQEA